MFFIGCFGLPWLWLVNCLYFIPIIRSGQASSTLKKCILLFPLSFISSLISSLICYLFVGFYLSLVGSFICFTALFIWIITFQVSWRDWSDAKSYMIYVPEEDRNNW